MTEPTIDEQLVYWRGRAQSAWVREEKAAANLLALVIELGDLRDEIADRANVEADLRAQLAELWPHYTSTYCIHAHHEDCRETCKICKKPCLCDCHKAMQ